jgi:hypothetical protein
MSAPFPSSRDCYALGAAAEKAKVTKTVFDQITTSLRKIAVD